MPWIPNLQGTSAYCALGKLGGMAVSIDRESRTVAFKVGCMGYELPDRFPTMEEGKRRVEAYARELLGGAQTDLNAATGGTSTSQVVAPPPDPAPTPSLKKRAFTTPPAAPTQTAGLFAAFNVPKGKI